MQGIAAGLLDRRDHAWMVVSNRGTDLARGEVEHSLAIPRLHERSRRPAHPARLSLTRLLLISSGRLALWVSLRRLGRHRPEDGQALRAGGDPGPEAQHVGPALAPRGEHAPAKGLRGSSRPRARRRAGYSLRCPRSPRPPTCLSLWAGRLRLRIAVISTRWPAASPKMRPSTGGRFWGTTSRGGRPFAASLRTGLARTRRWSSGLRKSATSGMGLCLPWSFRTVVRLAAAVIFDSARDGSSSGREA